MIYVLQEDIAGGEKESVFGRKDTPGVEQIVRAAIYKELKGLEYRELEYHQIDSLICARFIKIDELRPYSFRMYRKYISRLRAENLEKVLYELNKIAIHEGLEDLEKIRQDSTVVESHIHYPTNNSLLWDCIKEAYRLPGHLTEEVDGLSYTDYSKEGKKTYFKINVTKGSKLKNLIYSKLATFIKTINQVSYVIKKSRFAALKTWFYA